MNRRRKPLLDMAGQLLLDSGDPNNIVRCRVCKRLDAEWTALQRDRRAEWGAFCELFRIAELTALAKGWGIHCPDNATGKQLRQIVAGQQRTLPRPKCVADLRPAAKPPRAKKSKSNTKETADAC